MCTVVENVYKIMDTQNHFCKQENNYSWFKVKFNINISVYSTSIIIHKWVKGLIKVVNLFHQKLILSSKELWRSCERRSMTLILTEIMQYSMFNSYGSAQILVHKFSGILIQCTVIITIEK